MEAYRRRFGHAPATAAALTLLSLAAGSGCRGGTAEIREAGGMGAAVPSAPEGARQPAGHSDGERRAALLDGEPILWDELRPAMAEAAGGLALQEAVLDRMLAAELRWRGLSVAESDIAAERDLLLAAVSREALAAPGEAERLLEQVRRARNLGEERFQRLLRRNAQMRRLVRDSVEVTDEEVRQAFQMAHGPKFRARVIVVPTQRRAAELRDEILGITRGAPPPPPPDAATLARRFGDAAAAHSTDASAPRGGMLEAISPADPAYPAAAREALARLAVGELSPIIPAERGFALLLLEQAVPADGVEPGSVAGSIRMEVRRRRERIEMDDLARRLLRSANLSVLDRTLDRSWRNALGER
ncbi:MAG: peptidylprolyl isomerase [Phycisphaerales bacterium]